MPPLQPEDVPRGFVIRDSESWLPEFGRPAWLADFLFDLRVKRAAAQLSRMGCRRIVLYLWRPKYARALSSIHFDLKCYHIDDEYSFSDTEVPLSETERKLIAEVDQVFIHSQGLLEKKGRINPHTAYVPNGVDYQAFAEAKPQPPDMANIPHPRVGYTGWVKRQLDWPLLLYLTNKHVNWSFIFVGGHTPHAGVIAPIEELRRRPNVYFLGRKSTLELASYPQHFDVCIMPYRINDYTKYIYPLKLHEYLASGSPVVGARIRTLEAFSGVIGLAQTWDEWSSSLMEALSPASSTDANRSVRQAMAHRHDWQLLACDVAKQMAHRLSPEYASRLERCPGSPANAKRKESSKEEVEDSY